MVLVPVLLLVVDDGDDDNDNDGYDDGYDDI